MKTALVNSTTQALMTSVTVVVKRWKCLNSVKVKKIQKQSYPLVIVKMSTSLTDIVISDGVCMDIGLLFEHEIKSNELDEHAQGDISWKEKKQFLYLNCCRTFFSYEIGRYKIWITIFMDLTLFFLCMLFMCFLNVPLCVISITVALD